MTRHVFEGAMAAVSSKIKGRALDSALADDLNAWFPPDGEFFQSLTKSCARGEEEGWLMAREHGGIKFGRAIKPGAEAEEFSVDVVRMSNVKGPHHIHTTGEIGAIMPISGAPTFDGFGTGWYVYPPGSDHHPTVTGGDAYVLYLLPGGEIEFTGA